LKFAPYSSALGDVPDADPSSDLKGKKLGVAGISPNWRCAPIRGRRPARISPASSSPCLALRRSYRQNPRGRIDAVLNFWT
jgi:hypothetical protein